MIDVFARETMLFAGVGLLLGGLDDLLIDVIFIVLRVRYGRRPRLTLATLPPPSRPGRIAVFVAAWDEVAVIGGMLATALARYDHDDYRIYVGVYPNDRGTIDAVAEVAQRDARVRMVIGPRDGPTTKADCLNTLWRALRRDDARETLQTKAIVLHDAEDVVHAQELRVFDSLIDRYEVVQLPVLPLVNRGARLVSGHYADEFAESHAKQIIVRTALGAGMPLAGTGCVIAPDVLAMIAQARGGDPFDASSLTEDYELYGVQDKTYYVGKIFIPTWQLVLRPTARCGLQPFHIIIAANAVRRRQNWWIADWPLSNGRPRKAVARSGSTPKDTELPYPECGGVAEWRNGVLIDRCPQ
ncbi:glycosyltransferase [Sphingomonas sp. PP-CE-3G-477]|uniref:glycosyltransferase n=1 Tax=Sphingomonas sp. PP-CE-3G-477 TaxID=2135660 RepID=UPI000D33F838|nr:glycosyltransferase [Sphingomonas sp. PP-CE-3G-477]